MEQKYIYVIVVFAIIGILAVTLVSAYGFRGIHKQDLSEDEIDVIKEQYEAFNTALENNDYGAWESLMLEKIEKMRLEITRENFDKMRDEYLQKIEMNDEFIKAKESGDFSELKEKYGYAKTGHKGFRKGFKETGTCPYSKFK
ncbi:hypothetical protein GOV12_04365 [Candidatus Pacearchaeota archaeon]|nr:hypothetical protein [Candidatus Pacearchaeota archaeon]